MMPLQEPLFGAARRLREANDRLRREVAAHEATLRELEAARRDLEVRVAGRTKELSIVTARFETALRGAKIYVFSQDRDLRYTWFYSPLGDGAGMLGRRISDIVGQTDECVLPLENRAGIIALKRNALESGIPRQAEVGIAEGSAVRWYDLHVEPLRDDADSIVGLICAAVDVTERKEDEAHLRLLMRELTHRSKNLLAIIEAMARQTARSAGSIDAFVDQFSARIQALATSHDLLVQESWHGVLLRELVRSQLGHYLGHGESQVSLDGPAIVLKPEVAQSLGLAFHELAANAAQFGALSVAAGRVAVTWQQRSEAEGDGLEILWSEDGGPKVQQPERRGFGRMVIERSLTLSLAADVDLAFAPAGVRCRLVLPASRFSAR